eukprot:2773098-Rhodomonas_salina.2
MGRLEDLDLVERALHCHLDHFEQLVERAEHREVLALQIGDGHREVCESVFVFAEEKIVFAIVVRARAGGGVVAVVAQLVEVSLDACAQVDAPRHEDLSERAAN